MCRFTKKIDKFEVGIMEKKGYDFTERVFFPH